MLNNKLRLLSAFTVMAVISLSIYFYVDSTLQIEQVPVIDAAELYGILGQDSVILIDVRPVTESELKKDPLPGSVELPLEYFPEKESFFENNKDKFFVIYGNIEQRSKAAVKILQNNNMKAVYLSGGLKSWYIYKDQKE